MVLETPQKTLEITLAASVTTSKLQWSCDYSDDYNDNYLNGTNSFVTKQPVKASTAGTIGDVKPITVLKGIQSDTGVINQSREIIFFSINNSDTARATVTIRYTIVQEVGNISTIIFKATLMPGFQIVYRQNDNFRVYDQNGATPTVNYVVTVNDSVEIDFVASENIAQYDIVTSEGYRADSNDYNTRNKVIGFATTNILSGFPGKVLTLGELENVAWTWSAGDRLFVGVLGATVNAAPASTYVQIVGTALSATKIDVYVHQAVLL